MKWISIDFSITYPEKSCISLTTKSNLPETSEQFVSQISSEANAFTK